MRFDFRFARSSDATAVWALRTQAIRLKCSSHYPADVIESWAAAEMPSTFGALIENEHFVVAEQGGRIVGYAGLKPAEQEIEAIFVSPDFSGQGLGALLLERAEKQARGLRFKTVKLHASLNAVRFYQRAGYSEMGRGWHSSRSGLEIACVHMEKNFD
ncbi:GNAT family N-acetyltransferase [Natronospirillum operosum]|uniref:GNAT family N-acetyltransferase n=1 Tax=Natronospirillum operosum TaxID=2759953 RepID=A0A4Z0W9Y2_9GAMM|nr:GNAT family N-acetyltransferase [Natronospirillum operosum]TGG95429.1 GNAT family N-acetyltransferase [Natronospirillum operosum]